MPNKEDYKSWDYFQRNVKSNALIDSYPSIKDKILRVMDEVEEMLDWNRMRILNRANI